MKKPDRQTSSARNLITDIEKFYHISFFGEKPTFLKKIKLWLLSFGLHCIVVFTIGQDLTSDDRGVPRIGNNVWIGTGSIITGNITIGDGAAISAGSVLIWDVPSRCLVGGDTARVILNNYDNSKLLMYRKDNDGEGNGV